MTNEESVLGAALKYAERNWRVFPVRGKRPAISGSSWSDMASDNPHQITAWYAGASNLGIGIDLASSGLVVIDGDNLQALHAVIPDELLSGARYRGNPERCSYVYRGVARQAKFEWGEVKAGGGYVVFPPSPHISGGKYQWLDDWKSIPEFPAELAELVAPKASEPITAAKFDGNVRDADIEWARGFLEHQAKELESSGIGGRNNQLNTAALLAGHYCPHYLAESQIRDRLIAAAISCGLVRDDGMRSVRQTISSGLKFGMHSPQAAPTSGGVLLEAAHSESLFDESPILTHIRIAARSRMLSPWAVLGAILALAVAEIPPNVVLPGFVGGEASLNSYVALVGPSGSAKSATFQFAQEFLHFANPRAKYASIGSGEGLLDNFLEFEKGNPEPQMRANPHAVLYSDEASQLEVMQSRAGSSLAPLLCTLWNGADAGLGYAVANGRKRFVRRHTYRLSLVAGMQPELSSQLLNRQDAGTPQRFLLMPAIDPRMPDITPEYPGRLNWIPPVIGGSLRNLNGYAVLDCPDEIARHIRDEFRDRQKGSVAVEPLDSHSSLVRLKVAAGLSILHGYSEVTLESWNWAETVMRVHRDTRNYCISVLTRKAEDRQEQLGKADESRDHAKLSAADKRIKRAAQTLRKLVEIHNTEETITHGRAHKMGMGCSNGCLNYSLRHYEGLDSAIVSKWAVRHGILVKKDGRYYPGNSE